MSSTKDPIRCDECGGHGYLEVSLGGEREKCEECGVPREKHGTYPTCATHEFRACCSTTPSEPYRKDCWDAGECLRVRLPAWQDVLGEAEQVVRQKHIYNKYIKGTILENDVPVWIADFSQRTLMRERARVAAIPDDCVTVPIEPPLSLLPHLTNYDTVEHMDERDRAVILARLRSRWLAILEALRA